MVEPSNETDDMLATRVADVIQQPRVNPADSFVLHAPLELLARTALLPRVLPAFRDAARSRIDAVAAEYALAEPMPDVSSRHDYRDPNDALAALVTALSTGDVDGVDAPATWLADSLAPEDLRDALAAVVLPSLAAAAHGSIFLYLLPRVAPGGGAQSRMVRPLVRELARHPDWNLSWYEPSSPRPSYASHRQDRAIDEALFAAVAAAPSLGVPGSAFIFPLMHQAETRADLSALLGDAVDHSALHSAARTLQRAAALTMLLEPPDHAPYGWSHTLTMTQAALGVAPALADPRIGIAIAATYVVGFRCALAHQDLVATYTPEPPPGDLAEVALRGTPSDAAAAMWHTDDAHRPGLLAALVSRAAAHEDAHLVKYTQACLDAAAADPAGARIYMAAMTYLNAFWNHGGC